MSKAQWDAPVMVSARLSCGCTFRPRGPIKNKEAAAHPGTVVICDVHDEYAVVMRVSTRLVATHDLLMKLLIEDAQMDPDDASSVASEQLS